MQSKQQLFSNVITMVLLVFLKCEPNTAFQIRHVCAAATVQRSAYIAHSSENKARTGWLRGVSERGTILVCQ